MQYSKSALEVAERFEGCELKAYKDQGGTWTIGYGHTDGVYKGQRITLNQAEQFLSHDLQLASECVNVLVTVALTQPEFDALTDFVFNLGCGSLRGSVMLRYLNAGNFQAAANEFQKWSHVGAQVVAGLLARREAEESLFDEKIAAC